MMTVKEQTPRGVQDQRRKLTERISVQDFMATICSKMFWQQLIEVFCSESDISRLKSEVIGNGPHDPVKSRDNQREKVVPSG
jgi:hypothetical protein